MLRFPSLFNRRSVVLIALCGIFMVAGFGVQPGLAQTTPTLFSDLPAGVSASADRDVELQSTPALIRMRYTAIDLAPLRAKAPNVVMNLFPDMAYGAMLTQVTPLKSGSGLIWSGTVNGNPYSEVIMTVLSDGTVRGYIRDGARIFDVLTVRSGLYAIQERDEKILSGLEQLPMIPANQAQGVPQLPSRPLPGSLQDVSTRIDVLIVYSISARTAAGGTNQIVAEANTAIASANQSMTNSGIATTFNLVGTAEMNYTDSGNFSTDLNRLTSTSDGYMDDAHTLREQYKADMVSLLVSSTQYCGIAWLMTNVSTSFASSAFSVVARTCISNLSFQHELGHNMGSNHDPANSGGGGAYSYSYGYQDPGFFRTVMAYSCSPSCPRVNWFSSPNRNYNGRVMGTSTQNNTLSLQNTISTVANFRQGDGAIPTATPTRTATPNPNRPDTIGLYNRATGQWMLRNTNTTGNADITGYFGGVSGDLPVVGDWNSDGIDTVGIYRSSTGTFFLSNSNTSPVAAYQFIFGNPNDTPFAGRWDNTVTHSGVGVYRNSNGVLYLKNALSTGFDNYYMIFGNPGDVGLGGDWDGNGFDSIGIYRASNQRWYLNNDQTNGINLSEIDFQWSISTGKAVVGDWDGNLVTTVGFYSTTGQFTLHSANSTAGNDTVATFSSGGADLYPVAGKWTAGSSPSAVNITVIQPNQVVGNTNGAD
jgi:hypothetical protein